MNSTNFAPVNIGRELPDQNGEITEQNGINLDQRATISVQLEGEWIIFQKF